MSGTEEDRGRQRGKGRSGTEEGRAEGEGQGGAEEGRGQGKGGRAGVGQRKAGEGKGGMTRRPGMCPLRVAWSTGEGRP